MNFEVFHGGKMVDITTQDRVKEAQLKPFLNATQLCVAELYFLPQISTISNTTNKWFQEAVGVENGLLHIRELLLEAEKFDPQTMFYLPDDPTINYSQLKDDVNAELGDIPFYTTYNFPVRRISMSQTLMAVDNSHNLVCRIQRAHPIKTIINHSKEEQKSLLNAIMSGEHEGEELHELYDAVINDYFYFKFDTPEDSFSIKDITEKSPSGIRRRYITCGLTQHDYDISTNPPYFQQIRLQYID